MSSWMGIKTKKAVQRDKSLDRPESEAHMRIMVKIIKVAGKISRGKLCKAWENECKVGRATFDKTFPLMLDNYDEIVYKKREREFSFVKPIVITEKTPKALIIKEEEKKINNNKSNLSLSLLTIDEDNRVFYGDSRDE